ncbi:hypothetical protein, partial [Enhygromyxa salina]|uniref:hypothetical protein n=1 Tax=Enhygromyxa salina TaxID=215803 RepID=UPI0011B26840
MRDRATGKVRLVRGEVSYLVDPRKEEHVARRVSVKDWNLWIGATQAHRMTCAEVETPWALSIYVPTNHAALVASRHGRRVIVGPASELLGYDEQLTARAGRRRHARLVPGLAARGAMPRAASLGLFAEGFVAKTCSTPGTAAFWLRALGE